MAWWCYYHSPAKLKKIYTPAKTNMAMEKSAYFNRRQNIHSCFSIVILVFSGVISGETWNNLARKILKYVVCNNPYIPFHLLTSSVATGYESHILPVNKIPSKKTGFQQHCWWKTLHLESMVTTKENKTNINIRDCRDHRIENIDVFKAAGFSSVCLPMAHWTARGCVPEQKSYENEHICTVFSNEVLASF